MCGIHRDGKQNGDLWGWGRGEGLGFHGNKVLICEDRKFQRWTQGMATQHSVCLMSTGHFKMVGNYKFCGICIFHGLTIIEMQVGQERKVLGRCKSKGLPVFSGNRRVVMPTWLRHGAFPHSLTATGFLSSAILGMCVRISPCSFPLHVVTPFSTAPSPSELGLSEDNFYKDTRITLFPQWSCRPGEV